MEDRGDGERRGERLNTDFKLSGMKEDNKEVTF